MEIYNYNELKKVGLDIVFVQNSQSKRGVLRGTSFSKEPFAWKVS